MAWMIKHHQLVMANKGVALMVNYGLEEKDGQFKGPLSYKQYLWHILQHHFWGDEIILYAISCMWKLMDYSSEFKDIRRVSNTA